MAMHFARAEIKSLGSISSRLDDATYHWVNRLPPYRRIRYLASRSLLAELMFMLYAIKRLPDITLSSSGRPQFSDSALPDFSLAYTGNIVGVLLAHDGRCGLSMSLHRHVAMSPLNIAYAASGNETIWADNQQDPSEAHSQLQALRKSVIKLIDEPTPISSLQLRPFSGRLKIDNVPYIETISDVEDILIWGCAATLNIEKLHLWVRDQNQYWQKLRDIQTGYQSLDLRLIRLTTECYG